MIGFEYDGKRYWVNPSHVQSMRLSRIEPPSWLEAYEPPAYELHIEFGNDMSIILRFETAHSAYYWAEELAHRLAVANGRPTATWLGEIGDFPATTSYTGSEVMSTE